MDPNLTVSEKVPGSVPWLCSYLDISGSAHVQCKCSEKLSFLNRFSGFFGETTMKTCEFLAVRRFEERNEQFNGPSAALIPRVS